MQKNIDDYYLLLNQLFHDKPIKMHRVCQHYPTPETFYSAVQSGRLLETEISQKLKQKITHFCSDTYKNSLNQLGISWITQAHAHYPNCLKEIPDPPLILFYKGDIAIVNNPILSVVGPRYMSRYADKLIHWIVPQLVTHFYLASGLAMGVDTVVHRQTIISGKPSIGVTAIGLDSPYPKTNAGLYDEIIHRGGVVLSEQPPGVSPLPFRFPQRNRLLSGLSKGVLIIEAKERSGSLLTARFALEQNRDVFAFPQSIFSETATGVNRLIQDGAKLVQSLEDIINEYRCLAKLPYQESRLSYKLRESLSDNEARIWDVLETKPLHLDVISEKTQLSISTLLTGLSLLELKQLVISETGHYYYKCQATS